MSLPEPPIYISSFQQRYRHWYTATNGDAVHRFPTRLTEIWNQYSSIPDTPDAGLINNGDTAGVVELYKSRALTLTTVAGEAPAKFELAAGPGDLAEVVTATMGLVAPVAGSAAPTLSGLPADGYTPVIEDAVGNVFPMQASVWVVDGLNHFVEFPDGVPDTMVQPFSLTFFRYIGATGGSAVGPGSQVWHYYADVTGTTLAPDPAYAGAVAPSDFVVPLPAQSTEGAGTRMMFDASKGAFRAGTVSGAQWDDANRGTASFASGTDNTAATANSAVVGGSGNTVSGAATNSVIVGGSGLTISDQAETVYCQRLRINGGIQLPVRTVTTTPVTLGLDDHIVSVNTTAGGVPYVVNLPATPVAGQTYTIKRRTGSNNVQISGNGNNIDNNSGGVTATVTLSIVGTFTSVAWDSGNSLWLQL